MGVLYLCSAVVFHSHPLLRHASPTRPRKPVMWALPSARSAARPGFVKTAQIADTFFCRELVAVFRVAAEVLEFGVDSVPDCLQPYKPQALTSDARVQSSLTCGICHRACYVGATKRFQVWKRSRMSRPLWHLHPYLKSFLDAEFASFSFVWKCCKPEKHQQAQWEV